MASSGTLSLTVDLRYRPGERETSLVTGRARIKSTAVIEAEALELRTIREFITMPYLPSLRSSPTVLYGSVHLAGSLMNQVTLRSLRGSLGSPLGTVNLGTVPGGTLQMGFIAVGA